MSGTDAFARRSSVPARLVLEAAAAVLSTKPFAAVALEDVARVAAVDVEVVRDMYPSVSAMGGAILDLERARMHELIRRLASEQSDPLAGIIVAFEAVGREWADDIVVRAGVRLSAESRHHFPERRLNPFETWRSFVAARLEIARARSLLRPRVDVTDMTWVLVAAGIGAREIISREDSWQSAPDRMARAAHTLVDLITAPTQSPSNDPVASR